MRYSCSQVMIETMIKFSITGYQFDETHFGCNFTERTIWKELAMYRQFDFSYRNDCHLLGVKKKSDVPQLTSRYTSVMGTPSIKEIKVTDKHQE